MKTVTLNFFETPSHGYLQVHKNLVSEIGFVPPKGYSYFSPRTQTYYFEEDCDAPEFLNELKNNGIDYQIATQYLENESKIRNNPRIS